MILIHYFNKRYYVAKKTDHAENGIDNDLQSIEDEDGTELENIEGKPLLKLNFL